MRFKTAVSLFLCVPLVFSGCASRKPKTENSNPGALSASIAQEVAIGQQIHTQILSSFYPYTEPEVVGYVTKIGTSLAGHARRHELSYRFTVLYSDKIYAASAPGGFVYVTTGMLYFLQNESELAAVMAHEIAQLQNKDPELSKTKKVLESVTKGGAMVAPAFGSIGALAALGLAVVHNMSAGEVPVEKKLMRADAKAFSYMMEAGYDPQGMIDVFYRFLNAKGEIIPYFYDYYQSRPITEPRVTAMQKAFEKLPLDGKRFDTNYELYQKTMKPVAEIYRR